MSGGILVLMSHELSSVSVGMKEVGNSGDCTEGSSSCGCYMERSQYWRCLPLKYYLVGKGTDISIYFCPTSRLI